MNATRSFVLTFAILFGWLLTPGFAATLIPNVPVEPTVLMPAFVVKEEREQTKWRYVAHRDFEG